jgi:hypothetical protein
MQLVNLTGMALFGPGSEWLWTMLQMLILLGSGVAIFRQLRAQGSANALAIQSSLRDQWNSPELSLMRLEALIHIEEGRPGVPPTYWEVGNFFAYIAAIWTHRHVSERELWENWSGSSQFWWELAKPYLGEIRARNQGIYGEFEAFAKVMHQLDGRNGVPNFDPTYLAERRRSILERSLITLRLQNDARRGILPPFRGTGAAAQASAPE